MGYIYLTPQRQAKEPEMTAILTVTIFAPGHGNGYQDAEMIVDLGRMIDALEAKGFHSDPIADTEEDEDRVVYTYRHVDTGQIIDVTVWDEAPAGFAPINALPLEILA
jgi:hypothetical protein